MTAAEAPCPAPELRGRPGTVQLFSFSAARWNQHRMHYDERYTREHEGYEGLLVQGSLLGNCMLEVTERLAQGWGGGGALLLPDAPPRLRRVRRVARQR